MYVVLGANGRAGGEVARALLDTGEKVRVVLRRANQASAWITRGAEFAIADIDDVPAMTVALKGASGAFLLNPPPTGGDPYMRADEVGKALAKAVREAALPKAVVLSSIGAQHASGTGVVATLNQIETLLRDAAPAVTFLRPGYFIETWGEVARSAMVDGVLPTFLEPSQTIPMVSTIDVGRTAAALLCEQWTGERTVELAGPVELSTADVARSFAAVLGRPVAPIYVPPEHCAAALIEEGVPPEVAEALAGMYEGIASGAVAHEGVGEQRRGAVRLDDAIARIVAITNKAAA